MKRILFYAVAFVLTFLTSCKDDEDTFSLPVVTAPAEQTAETEASVDLTFDYSTEGGFKSVILVATNGTAVVKTNGTTGSTSGTIVVTFTAGATSGAGSVKVTVTDNENQNSQATAVLSIVEEDLEIDVTSNITANTTWESGKVYVLGSRIAVVSGVTLTIEPGVIVKGQAGTGSNATCLIIARGAKIDAQGTETSPIIFTSIADELEPGDIASPNLEPTMNGLWGGLLILGNAPISGSSSPLAIEGIPATDPNGLYGGSNINDNSGILKYVSIRHGGANIGEGNEINGLTLGGVGDGTIIENVEIIANQDDGIEWFGGTVNVKNAIIWNTGDDAVDTDQAWGGKLDNFIVINPGDECFELDGGEGTTDSTHIITNGSVYAGGAEGLADLDDDSFVSISNVYFFGLTAGQDFDEVPANNKLTLSNIQATLPVAGIVTEFFKEGSDAFVTVVATPSVGADKTKFAGWSWTALSGELDSF